ncbi:MAG: PTS sugar transporter subunit IIA [Candidatus Schekmanbacteria bacterium]|nr:PTS sugar transporter subunit IIA [Candidatus Schekmanbacteria bacterium]
MKLTDYLKLDWIEFDLHPKDKRDVLQQLVDRLHATGDVRAKKQLMEKLWEREQLMSTGIGSGIAIPHATSEDVSGILVGLGRVPGGVEFAALDEQPVYLVFLLVAPLDARGQHVKLLARISRMVKQAKLVERLRDAGSAEQMFRVVADAEEETT